MTGATWQLGAVRRDPCFPDARIVPERCTAGGFVACGVDNSFLWRRDTWRAEVAKCGATSKAKVARMATYGGYVGRRGPNSIDFDLVN